MTNSLHFSEWRICIRAQRKANLCAPAAPKGPKVGMSVRQYEILCANDAGRAPRKYPELVASIQCVDIAVHVPILWFQWLTMSSHNSCMFVNGAPEFTSSPIPAHAELWENFYLFTFCSENSKGDRRIRETRRDYRQVGMILFFSNDCGVGHFKL